MTSAISLKNCECYGVILLCLNPKEPTYINIFNIPRGYRSDEKVIVVNYDVAIVVNIVINYI